MLRELAEIRYPVYAEAALTVDTDGLSITAAVNTVEEALREFLKLSGNAEGKGWAMTASSIEVAVDLGDRHYPIYRCRTGGQS